MSQISPPVRILLVGCVVFLAAWMTVLKPKDAATPEPTNAVPRVAAGGERPAPRSARPSSPPTTPPRPRPRPTPATATSRRPRPKTESAPAAAKQAGRHLRRPPQTGEVAKAGLPIAGRQGRRRAQGPRPALLEPEGRRRPRRPPRAAHRRQPSPQGRRRPRRRRQEHLPLRAGHPWRQRRAVPERGRGRPRPPGHRARGLQRPRGDRPGRLRRAAHQVTLPAVPPPDEGPLRRAFVVLGRGQAAGRPVADLAGAAHRLHRVFEPWTVVSSGAIGRRALSATATVAIDTCPAPRHSV